MKTTTHQTPLLLDHIIYSKLTDEPKRIFLLLHGYLLDGQIMYKHFENIFPKDSLVLAPNAPIPVPLKKKGGYSVKYAWYYFDPEKKNYYINFDPAASFLKEMLSQYPELPTTVIGYSQGGYLAPKVAEVCEQVDEVIGICATFRVNRFQQKNIPYSLINSEIDKVVEIENSREEFLKLENNKGEFIVMPEAVHRLGPEHRNALQEYIKKYHASEE
ncbi:MAG: hypothetical protein CME62_11700 [Halobacteriovoraceae bacterium]|nr:hypothetical protein [Halobacteriovoraceae bacterium]